MRSILRSMMALAAVGFASMGATSELSAGGGCGMSCSGNGFCTSGGPPTTFCVQGYEGGQPVCQEFPNYKGCFTLGPTPRTTCDLELVERVIAAMGGFTHSGPLTDVIVEAERQHLAMLAELGFVS